MKKLPVLIVLLVVVLSFIGASSIFGKSKKTGVVSTYSYELEDPESTTTTNKCVVFVKTTDNKDNKDDFSITLGSCEGNKDAFVGSRRDLNHFIQHKLGLDPANVEIDFEGWIYVKSSPGSYCYVHPVTDQYICIRWQ
jgi:hypothetical protein